MNESDVTKMKSFLKATKLPLGMLINFGKESLEVKNINR